MKRRCASLAVIGVLFSASAGAASYDVIIRGGTVLDGSGQPGFKADVGIDDGHIARIGDLSGDKAGQEIDAAGLYVAPGFINIHDHPTPEGLVHAANMLNQGVTTEILNPDGGIGESKDGDGADLRAELRRFAGGGIAVNIGGYVGFNLVWQTVMGATDHRAGPEDIVRMKALIENNLRAGAFGLSAGLDYRPGYYATTDEVIAISKAAAGWRTNFPNHERLDRQNGFSSRAGIAETIRIGEEAGVAPEITHIKSQGLEQGKAGEIVAMMQAATDRGHYASADLYPYIAGQTRAAALLLPGWAEDGGRDAMLARFKDPEQHARLVKEIEVQLKARFGGPENVYFPASGKRLSEIMKESGRGSPGEALIEVLEQTDAVAILFFGSDADVETFLRYPETAIACDCGADLAPAHPRYFGTFPKILGHYVRERHVLSLEEAVRRMTGLPASMIGLVDRGFVAPGMAADITVFNAASVTDHATFDQPRLPSEGIRDVLVNGRVALRDGNPTEAEAGRTLLRGEHMPTRRMRNSDRSVHAEAELDGGIHLAASLQQKKGERTAHGRMRLTKGGKTLLDLTDPGILQTEEGWASLTGAAEGRPVTVIFDKADPQKPGRTTLVVEGAGLHIEADATGKVDLSR